MSRISRRVKRLGIGLVAVVLVAVAGGSAASGSDGPTDAKVLTLMKPAEQPESPLVRSDDKSVELGLRFSTSSPGYLMGLRFFRGVGDESAHTGSLWSADGEQLASLSFRASGTTGWQYATFDAPVQLEVGEMYVASYHTDVGYVADEGYFAKAHARGPISAPVDEPSSPNGVFGYGDEATFPTESYLSRNYWVDVLFVEGDMPPPDEPAPPVVAEAPGTPPVSAAPTATPGPAPPTPGPLPPPPVTEPPTGGGTPGGLVAGQVPNPGQVGFLGDPASLTVVDSSATAPAGTKWSGSSLRVDEGDVTLENVHVKGGIDFYGSGTLTIRNSIIDGGGLWAIIMARNPAGHVDISDSTLRWPADAPPPGASWGNGAIHGDTTMIVVRCDISGTPDGVQQGSGNSRFEQNYIHDLAMIGTYPDNTHNDGLQFYSGPGMVVQYNRIELNGYDGTHQNSAVFFSDDGAGFESPQIIGNYLSGGGYPLRLETGTSNAVVVGNTFGPLNGGFGEVDVSDGASIAQWTDNLTAVGAELVSPLLAD